MEIEREIQLHQTCLINRSGLSYGSDISRRQTKLTQPAECCIPTDLPGHYQPNVSHKAEQKQTRRGPQWLILL